MVLPLIRELSYSWRTFDLANDYLCCLLATAIVVSYIIARDMQQ